MKRLTKILALLFLLFSPFLASAYVISETLVEFAQRNYPDILILGDGHYADPAAKKHFEVIKAELLKRSKQDARVYVSIEDRPWESKDVYTGSTLNDLVVFAREHNNKIGSVTFGSTDCRPLALIWPMFFASKYSSTGPGATEEFSQTLAWLQKMYGDSVPTAHQVITQAQQYLARIKKVQPTAKIDLSSYIEELESDLPYIVDAFKEYGNQSLSEVFYQWHKKDPSMIGEIHTPLLLFMNAMSEIGFLLDYFEKKDQFDQVVFFVGHAHACSIIESLKMKHASDIKTTSKGSEDKFVQELIPLPTSQVAAFLKALPCSKRAKTKSTATIDVLLFAMVALVGFVFISSSQPRRRQA